MNSFGIYADDIINIHIYENIIYFKYVKDSGEYTHHIPEIEYEEKLESYKLHLDIIRKKKLDSL